MAGVKFSQLPTGDPFQSGDFFPVARGSTSRKISGASILAAAAAAATTIPAGVIVMWSGASTAIPSGWALCNGSNGTPNLTNRFVVGAGATYAVGATGGADTVTLNSSHIANHRHHVFVDGSGTANVTDTTYANDSRTSVTFEYRYSISGVSSPEPTVGLTSTVVGGGTATGHENRPPYYALCYIMKL